MQRLVDAFLAFWAIGSFGGHICAYSYDV
jgi:hypothetical protein